MTKTTFGFIKDPFSTLHSLGALNGTTPIAVEQDKIVDAVSNVFTKLITRNADKYGKNLQDLSSFSVTFIQPASGRSSLQIESDAVVIQVEQLSDETTALFLNAIYPPQKSGMEWVVEALTYLVSRLVDALTYVFTTGRHFTKWTKYRLILEQLAKFATDQNVHKINISPTDLEITTTWNSLIEALLEPTHFETPDIQYRKIVDCLCKLRQLLINETSQEKLDLLKFVRELSYKLFTGIELFPYGRQLIEIGSGKPLPPVLTMDTFLEEFTGRATILKRPLGSTAMNPIAKKQKMLKGTINYDFSPLLKTSNIPYRDGVISANDKSTLMLWHGTPVEQHDPYGAMFDLVAGALSYIPYVGDWIGNSNCTNPPVINDHYTAFIEGAEAKGEDILHVILENGQKKRWGDESSRVKARVNLATKHKNFFPIALRLDGKFFERDDEFKDQAESIENLKKRLKKQLLMPLDNSLDESGQMEDQLAKTGFCVPQKLRDASKLEDNIDMLLQEVQDIYFPGKENIMTQAEHQAFLILSYVHIILFICWKMDIKILEALCKDDKDRGNVIKTMLKLHFLYITGQANHENLTSVLTHMLARPFILQKSPIVPSRLVLFERIIPFVKTAYNTVRVPETNVFGKKSIENASYVVDKPQGQTIYPKANSKTIGEYRAFLKNHRPKQIPPHHDNSIQEAVSEFYLNEQAQNADIQQKISETARTMLLSQLNEIFANPDLKISVKPTELSPSIRLTKETGLRYDACFSISDETVSYGSINASLTIKDLRTGQVQLEYSLV
jgi:hypothetical protein